MVVCSDASVTIDYSTIYLYCLALSLSLSLLSVCVYAHCSCGNVAAILELNETLVENYKVFEAAPQVCVTSTYLCVLCCLLTNTNSNASSPGSLQETRGIPAKRSTPDYFL
jgi:hypothetical protein